MFMKFRDWINIDKINFSLLCFNRNAIEYVLQNKYASGLVHHFIMKKKNIKLIFKKH
jgi:hypothetical protein